MAKPNDYVRVPREVVERLREATEAYEAADKACSDNTIPEYREALTYDNNKAGAEMERRECEVAQAALAALNAPKWVVVDTYWRVKRVKDGDYYSYHPSFLWGPAGEAYGFTHKYEAFEKASDFRQINISVCVVRVTVWRKAGAK